MPALEATILTDILRPVLPEVDVIGLGENSVDRVLVVSHLPGAAEALPKMRAARAMRSCGGQVATTMAACAALHLRAAYIGAVGNDDDGKLVRKTLQERGVNVAHLHVAQDAATRWATILVESATGERSVIWGRDDALSLTAAQIDAIPLGSARLVHIDTTDMPSSLRIARRARAAGLLVTTDIDMQDADGTDDASACMALMRLATHPILSERALAVLGGDTAVEPALRRLRRQCEGTIVVTLGACGAAALDDNRFITANGFPVQAVDTTGAGDVFRAGFIASLLAERTLGDALRFATAAAAASCTKMGAITGAPTLAEVRTLLR